jgi:ubiquinone/menaquinone biosynthesis C-methylase UbiE
MQRHQSGTKDYIKRYWDTSSLTYDDKSGHGIQTLEERRAWGKAFDNVLPKGHLEVLDVGCGTGELSLLLAEMGYSVTGIDLSDSMIDKAIKKNSSLGLNARFITGDAEEINFDGEVFDVVFNRHLLWTLPHPEKAIKDWRRVLKDNGYVIIIDGYWRKDAIESRLRRLISGIGVLIFERKNPWKGWYTKEVRSSLPHPYGLSPEKSKDYLETSGFKDIKIVELKEILEIHTRESPVWQRIACDWPYYMAIGKK